MFSVEMSLACNSLFLLDNLKSSRLCPAAKMSACNFSKMALHISQSNGRPMSAGGRNSVMLGNGHLFMVFQIGKNFPRDPHNINEGI